MDAKFAAKIIEEWNIMNDILQRMVRVAPEKSALKRTSTPLPERKPLKHISEINDEDDYSRGYKNFVTHLETRPPLAIVRGVIKPPKGILSGNIVPCGKTAPELLNKRLENEEEALKLCNRFLLYKL